MPDHTLLERNLLALALNNPDVSRELSREDGRQDVTPAVSFTRARTGATVPVLGIEAAGLPLHSTFNPEREGERFLDMYAGDGVLLFLGLGAGYHIAPFLALETVSSILVVDQSLPLLHRVLESIDLTHIFLDPRVKLLVDKTADEIEEYLLSNYIPGLLGDLKSIPLWPRFTAAKEYFKDVLQAVERVIGKVADDYTVQSRFGKKWFVNTLFNFRAAERASTTLSPHHKVMVTGAGPSLEAGIDHIRADRKDYFLIASDTSLPCLLSHGIEPDCVISIDCQQVSYHHFLSGFPRHIPLVLDLASPPLLSRLSDRLIFFSSGHPFSQFLNRRWRVFPRIDTSGGNVSHAAVSLAASLGAREIRLFGVDFSYPEGKTYARGTYLYRYFRVRENRLSTVETAFCDLIFRNKTVLSERLPGFIRYTTKPLLSYKERMEWLFRSIDVTIVHRPVKGIAFDLPQAHPPRAERMTGMFSAGAPVTSADEFLAGYREELEQLPAPHNPVINYLHELTGEQRALWATLMPTLASLRAETKGSVTDGARLLSRVRDFALERLRSAEEEPAAG